MINNRNFLGNIGAFNILQFLFKIAGLTRFHISHQHFDFTKNLIFEKKKHPR